MQSRIFHVAKLASIYLCCGALAYAQNPALPDLDRDGIPNISDPDVDNDGLLNGKDSNIDGGKALSGPLRGKVIGDQLLNSAAAELDMDADGLADNAAAELDIDGDGLLDSDRKRELDIDGDGVPNGLDTNLDGDGLSNAADADMFGDGVINDIFAGGGADGYAPDATVAATIEFVTAELRKSFQIPATDAGLRVKSLPQPVSGRRQSLSPPSNGRSDFSNTPYPVCPFVSSRRDASL
jgi:hypothetical protein